MDVFHFFGTEEQKRKWLVPLANGEIRSSFVMTEPGLASSDAVQISTSIRKEGSDYVINGEKIWITGAGDKRNKIYLLLGRTGTGQTKHDQHSVVLVPTDSPGITVLEPFMLYGFDDGGHGGHHRVKFENVRIPQSNLVGKEGMGFKIAQVRLAGGRLHHCARTVGLAERAIDLLKERLVTRTVQGGKPLKDLSVLRAELAEARISVDQMRLLVLDAAHKLDKYGSKDARASISMAKVRVPEQALKVINTAMEVYGGLGLSSHIPLASWYARTDSVKRMDGPCAVHREVVAKMELREFEKRKSKL
uniref:Acyl-CoA dehydrogenase/oxidase C-terminal domain-containing protein n=1 Tax=Paramoeba aestuarina TaxID=180227 RepID=A0A7S4NSN7_9EUKA|mmetsp:Transcript_25052/g.39019  ORF Transcript_25052/g.39019 Transcript_25052/m.39019 type:complete len:305 (+) Transcript_25052:1015-1929(+)